MKTAVLTWYSGNNYGSSMQAYALAHYLSSIGAPSELLVYTPNKITAWKRKIKNHNVMTTLRYKANELYVRLAHRQHGQVSDNMDLFDAFRQTYMRFSPRCVSPRDLQTTARRYDAVICGSDQIWNPYFFDPVYYLSFVEDPEKRVAYAPSLGVEAIPDRVKQDLAQMVAPIRHLSVREEHAADLLAGLIGRRPAVVADPVMLLEAETWLALASDAPLPVGKPYLLCYFLRHNPAHYAKARKLADQFGMEVQTIPMLMGDCKRADTITQPIGPREWIALIRDASFVLTDSFHCSLFSIILRKDFYSLPNTTEGAKRQQNSRIENLLRMTQLESRFLTGGAEPALRISTPQYQKAQQNIAQKRAESGRWLTDALRAVEARAK